ncbi:uncharacterized protein LOC121656537 isoform X2 [Melanotaenia boesemani]|uniref:uncharacterized protein LOC121656537 isoform X2 n=1 Tax=Melanotaenia boesemani TaxID=1250792 RepID=UPI001C053FB4|nr:uncharacterized protein LOC121656537 isoform X2 [Melanotaenia boesemani]XP_041867512.1 uncharacterized protein LOC121656537 isoform X2 [Melanotaenia boesemani]XP_041867513.1 uncharacterized protein LOC121656537 isoform X2 [Melanotaenia boesemani]
MEPEGSSKSQLFDSLQLYLNKKNRLQPIIGLKSIIECVNVSTLNKEALFLCEVCVCRLGKADMRNHILGSLHRFNYIKACHPHLVSKWETNSDLSELAWPLMELAKMLEGNEGPGNVQLFEVEDAVYKRMATQSENHAVTLIKELRDEQAESGSFPETTSLHYPVTSERIVLLTQNQPRYPNKSHKAGTESFEMSTHTSKFLPQVTADAFSSVKSKVCLSNKSTPQLEIMQTSPEPPVLSEYSNTFPDDYSGDKPLIGLVRVVEFRSEGGCSYCFLCHCCRIRCNKKDIIDHLFSSSHLINYLMETHSDEVEEISEDIEDNCQLLQSLAKEVEQDEGRGELKVVEVPESQCRQLTGKSYHWCLKMLSSGWTHSNTENKRNAVKGACVNKTSVRRLLSKQPTSVKRKKKMKKKTNTVFNVSLPLPKGEMLLQGRTSFTADNLLESSVTCLSDYDPVSPLDSETLDCRLECDSSPFADTLVEETSDFQTSPLQQDLFQSHPDADQYIPEHNPDTAFQDGDGHGKHNMCFNQFQDITGTENNTVYEEWRYNRQHDYHEMSSNDAPTQSEELFPAAPHTDGSSYSCYSRQQQGGDTEQCYFSASDSDGGTRQEASKWERNYKDISSNALQNYYQQQYLSQQMAWANANVQPGSMWGYHGMYDEVPHYLDTGRINMQAQSGSTLLHNGGISSEPTVQFHNADLSQMQTCTLFSVNHFQAAPQNYMTQSPTYQASQADHRLMSSTNYNVGPWSNPLQQFAYPASSASSGYNMMQANAVIPPGQPLYHDHHDARSDVYLRAGAPFR